MKKCKHCGEDPEPMKSTTALGRTANYCGKCEGFINATGICRAYRHQVPRQTPSLREIQREMNAATNELKRLLT